MLRSVSLLCVRLVAGVPMLGMSALTGVGAQRFMPTVLRQYRVWNKRVSTSKMNRWLEQASVQLLFFSRDESGVAAASQGKGCLLRQVELRWAGYILKPDTCTHISAAFQCTDGVSSKCIFASQQSSAQLRNTLPCLHVWYCRKQLSTSMWGAARR